MVMALTLFKKADQAYTWLKDTVSLLTKMDSDNLKHPRPFPVSHQEDEGRCLLQAQWEQEENMRVDCRKRTSLDDILYVPVGKARETKAKEEPPVFLKQDQQIKH